MAMKLMYITNSPEVALIAEKAGVQRIFVDMEFIGKSDRQGGMDTVQSHHNVADIRAVKQVLTTSSVMCRVNPIHRAGPDYVSSRVEINAAIEAGADVLMLPYFKTVREVEKFLELVDGRVRTLPLVETPEAVECIDEILALPGVDEMFIGLNDLSLGYHKKFMFELLCDGTVEKLCGKFREKGIPYGFGGIASLGKGMLPSEYVIREHYRLGSTCAILSRSFCNLREVEDLNEVDRIFRHGLRRIREFECECESMTDFTENSREIARRVALITGGGQ